MKQFVKFLGTVGGVSASLIRQPSGERSVPTLQKELHRHHRSVSELHALNPNPSRDQISSALVEGGFSEDNPVIASLLGQENFSSKLKVDKASAMSVLKKLKDAYSSAMISVQEKMVECASGSNKNYKLYENEHRTLEAAMNNLQSFTNHHYSLLGEQAAISAEIDREEDEDQQTKYNFKEIREPALKKVGLITKKDYIAQKQLLCVAQCKPDEKPTKGEKALLQDDASAALQMECMQSGKTAYLSRVFLAARQRLSASFLQQAPAKQPKLSVDRSSLVCPDSAYNCRVGTTKFANEWGKKKAAYLAAESDERFAKNEFEVETEEAMTNLQRLNNRKGEIATAIREVEEAIGSKNMDVREFTKKHDQAFLTYRNEHQRCEKAIENSVKASACIYAVIFRRYVKNNLKTLIASGPEKNYVNDAGSDVQVKEVTDLDQCEWDEWDAGNECGIDGIEKKHISCIADGAREKNRHYATEISIRKYTRRANVQPAKMRKNGNVVLHSLALPCPTLQVDDKNEEIQMGIVHEERTAPCNMFPCPQDCVESPFGSWGTCSAVCDGGTQARRATVVQRAKHGGLACTVDQLYQTKECNVNPCDQDCQVARNKGQLSTCKRSCHDAEIDHTSVVPAYAKAGEMTSFRARDWQDDNGRASPGDAVRGYSIEGAKILAPQTGAGTQCPSGLTQLGGRVSNWDGSVKMRACDKHDVPDCSPQRDEVCLARMNLVVVIDASTNLEPKLHQDLMNFSSGVLDIMLPRYKGLSGVRVGVVVAGNGKLTDCDKQGDGDPESSVAMPLTPLGGGLSDHTTRAEYRTEIVEKVKKLKQFDGFFNLAQALDKARIMLMNDQQTYSEQGDVPWAQKILVITASPPTVWADAQRAASSVRRQGIELNFMLALPNFGAKDTFFVIDSDPALKNPEHPSEGYNLDSPIKDFELYKAYATFPWQMSISLVKRDQLKMHNYGQRYGKMVCPGGKAVSLTKWADTIIGRGYWTLHKHRDCYTWIDRIKCGSSKYCHSAERCIDAARLMSRNANANKPIESQITFAEDWPGHIPNKLAKEKIIKSVVYSADFDGGACFTQASGAEKGLKSPFQEKSFTVAVDTTCDAPGDPHAENCKSKGAKGWRCQMIHKDFNHYAIEYDWTPVKGGGTRVWNDEEKKKRKQELDAWLTKQAMEKMGEN